MRNAVPALGLGVAGLVVATGPARAELVGIAWEKDCLSLDGVTPLSGVPGYAGQAVYNIYALFDDETDQCVGVAGTPEQPFGVYTHQGAGFVNAALPVPNNVPPSLTQVEAFPSLNWDSFFTVGVKLSDQLTVPLLVAAGTPGPTTDPWPGNPGTATNMAWVIPPENQVGAPPPESIAGPDLRVLLVRLVVADESIGIDGQFGVIWLDAPRIGAKTGASFSICAADTNTDGTVDVADLVDLLLAWGSDDCATDIHRDGMVDVIDLVAVLVSWGGCSQPPPPAVGACCLPSGGCADFTASGCAAFGGVFQGAGAPCTPTPCMVTGACCLGSGACSDLTSLECAGRGGTYAGDGTACGSGACCGPGAGDCCRPHGSPACEDVECCQTVCSIDLFCCEVQWDQICAEDAARLCSICGGG